MAHVTLQLGTGLTIPFRRTRHDAPRHVGIYNTAWRSRALREAQLASVAAVAQGRRFRDVFRPLLPRRVRTHVVD
jgi:hypothetical protein